MGDSSVLVVVSWRRVLSEDEGGEVETSQKTQVIRVVARLGYNW